MSIRVKLIIEFIILMLGNILSFLYITKIPITVFGLVAGYAVGFFLMRVIEKLIFDKWINTDWSNWKN